MEVQKKKKTSVGNSAHNFVESRPLLSKPSEPLCKQPETCSQLSVNSQVTHQLKAAASAEAFG